MQKDRETERMRTREQLLDRYVLAIDSGDLEGMAATLDAAYEASTDDPEIGHLITEINHAYCEEEGLTPLAADGQLVREMLRRCVPSAFDTHDHLKRSLTVGDVASRLQAQGRVRPGDDKTNHTLLGNTVPLPKPLTGPAIKKLAGELGIGGSEFYWRTFRDEAITMGISRSHDQAKLAARARRARRPSRQNKKKQD
jgi:hypothetical protein